MKQLSRQSKLYRWAFLFEDPWSSETDTCTLFWRSVLLTPLKLLGITAIIGIIGFIGWLLIAEGGWRPALGAVGIIAATLLALVALGYTIQGVSHAHGVAKERGLCSRVEIK